MVLKITVCLNYELKMLRNLKVLYKYTDRLFTIFSLVDVTSRFNRKKAWKFVEFWRDELHS